MASCALSKCRAGDKRKGGGRRKEGGGRRGEGGGGRKEGQRQAVRRTSHCSSLCSLSRMNGWHTPRRKIDLLMKARVKLVVEGHHSSGEPHSCLQESAQQADTEIQLN